LTEVFVIRNPPADMVAVSRFVHPTRGVVSCPAVPAVAGWLRARGVSARVVDLDTALVMESAPGREPEGAGQLVATTYLDLDGRAFGIAAAARPPGESLAREAVDTWTATLRTRRALVPVNPRSSAPHPRPGIVPASRRADHGGQTLRPGQETVCPDAVDGCDLARATWRSITEFQARGDTVLLIGRATGTDPTLPGTLPEEDPEGLIPVTTPQQVAQLGPLDGARLSFALRPCTVVEEATPVLRALRSRFPMLRGQHPDQWCYQASDARHALRRAVEASDLVLFLGARDPHRIWPGGSTVRYLTDFEQLGPEDLLTATTIAVVDPIDALGHAAGSDMRLTAAEVVGVLAGLGPLSVVHHRAQTDTIANIRASTAQGTRRR
jgi:4-hydroxy-3-methylbut-2-enyl diphosphate reductase